LFDSILDWIRSLFGWLPPRPVQNPPPATCPISWQPSVVAPVFWGLREYHQIRVLQRIVSGTFGAPRESFGPPTPCRVFFPSLHLPPFDAPILEGCGSYPLILFAHGHCQRDNVAEQYRRWLELPAILARSGFVVVVPKLDATAGGSHPSINDIEVDLIGRVIAWMRTRWEHASILSPVTGVIGHSYGGMLAARYADEGSLPISAFASLSSGWGEWQPGVFPTDSPLPNLSIPGLLALGGADSDASVNLSALPGTKHGAVFTDAAHWDFLPGGRSPCQGGIAGPCDLTWALAADIVALFFGKYLPLESWPNLLEAIPNSLNPPRRRLSFRQMFYAIGHLATFSRLGSEPDCGVTLSWRTPNGNGSLTRP
jgi:pimeloyl-ACP methyl ester carboxylesterase